MFIITLCACLEIIDLVLSGRAWREWQVCGDGDKSAQEKEKKTASYHFLDAPLPPQHFPPGQVLSSGVSPLGFHSGLFQFIVLDN